MLRPREADAERPAPAQPDKVACEYPNRSRRLTVPRPVAATNAASLCLGQRKRYQIHCKELPPLSAIRALELLDDCRPPLQRRIECGNTVGAENDDDASAKAAQIVNPLNQRVDGHLVFMVAMLLGAHSGQ